MPGTVLLLAAAPLGRGRLVDAAAVLPVLAAVAPTVLSGTDTANVVELADPVEPQGVLTRLRAAAAAPGPLTVYLTGQLHLDRRQRLPHLALARTTPATVRYTAVPWHWIREELRLRAPRQTALVVDLHADPEVWRQLHEQPLDCGRTTAVYGRIAPPHGRRGPAEPSYMKTVATLLRSGHRPPLDELHQQALARIPEETPTNILLAPVTAPQPYAAIPHPTPGGTLGFGPAVGTQQTYGGPVGAGEDPVVEPGAPLDVPPPPEDPAPGAPDPHAAISTAVQAGRHEEADVIAARHQEAAADEHGPASEDALHWAEVRADLAMFAGDAARSCQGWMAVAERRLAAGQEADAPAVEAAVDRAHHQWGRIGEAARARELGPALAELRARVPGRRRGALEDVRRQLRELQEI
ncbi:hypothetical protein JG491_20015 [Streptomyces sp. CRPSP2-6A1]|uniref:hypothetical protein n=1 Tax=Streptomyces sp. CRPSP2-6A1 TaxID=2799588 RepID=UPI0018F07A40|nr:hypothetical protein [Streptomyces sp. CRPSP2-6A1]MBJ7002324.1 hypothetical protein [Streptomyces sp. CRPSP2-6A1]